MRYVMLLIIVGMLIRHVYANDDRPALDCRKCAIDKKISDLSYGTVCGKCLQDKGYCAICCDGLSQSNCKAVCQATSFNSLESKPCRSSELSI